MSTVTIQFCFLRRKKGARGHTYKSHRAQKRGREEPRGFCAYAERARNEGVGAGQGGERFQVLSRARRGVLDAPKWRFTGNNLRGGSSASECACTPSLSIFHVSPPHANSSLTFAPPPPPRGIIFSSSFFLSANELCQDIGNCIFLSSDFSVFSAVVKMCMEGRSAGRKKSISFVHGGKSELTAVERIVRWN